MERSLNLAQIQDALGQHETLPTPEELRRLMANLEVELFRHQLQVPDSVLTAGWYLHGIASSSAAPDLYSVERQRRAFQISAHVFDLALSDPHQPSGGRLRLGFASAIGYRRGELEPNAMAIYQRLADQLTTDQPLLDHINSVALEAGLAFLGFDPRHVGPLLRTLRRQFDQLRHSIGAPTLTNTMFAPPFCVVEGVHALLQFLVHGRRDELDIARDLFATAAEAEEGLGDLDARWVAAHLNVLAGDIDAGSVWSVLPPDVSSAARQTLTVTSPAVLTLWKPQVRLLQQSSANPLTPEVRRVVMSVPTSSGKTLLAQLFTISHLATQSTAVCYVAPMRSLGREMRRAMARRLQALRKELGRDLPDYPQLGLPGVDDAAPDVDVMTPERLAHLVHRDPEGVLERYGMFLFDEAHLMAERGRGFTLETLISFLHWRTRETPHRIVLLSAALGNRGQLMQWLDPDGTGALLESDWRGPRRLEAVFTTDIDLNKPTSTETVKRAKSRPKRNRYATTGVVRLRPAEGVRVPTLVLTEPVGVTALRCNEDGTDKKRESIHSTPNYKMIARAVVAVGHAGPVLVVRSTRPAARDMATAIAELLDLDPAARPIAEFARIRLGDAHPLVAVLTKGVAYHHGSLPGEVLEEIEDGLRDGRIRFMASTTTLTEGVNLPVRTVVIAETRYKGQPGEGLLVGARLINAMGRAGRACKESEGWVLLCLQKKPATSDFDTLRPTEEDLHVRSRLDTDEALDALAAFEDAVRAGEDAIFAYGANEINDFVAFVWFILAAEESLATEPDDADIGAALESTLGFAQLTPAKRARWMTVAEKVRDTYRSTDPTRRTVWPRAGTSVVTARALDSLATDLVEVATNTTDIETPTAALNILEATNSITTLLNLPEAPTRWSFKTVEQGRYTDVPVDPRELLADWLGGESLASMAERFLPAVTQPHYRIEQIVDAITEHFEHFLSWTLGVLVELTNDRLEQQGHRRRLCPDLPLYVRYGVESAHALRLTLGGVRSRELAHRVATSAIAGDMNPEDIRAWLGDMTIADWRTRFDPTAADLLDLLEYARVRRGSLLPALLSDGIATLGLDLPDHSTVNEPAVIGAFREEIGSRQLAVYQREHHTEPLVIIPARLLADLQAILDTGLEISCVLREDGLEMNLD